MLALHPRHLGRHDRAVLAGVQMPPAPLTRIVTSRRLAALRAAQRFAVVLHVHDHLALLQVQLHLSNSPGRLDAQNPRVQVLVTHGSSVALLPQAPRPRLPHPHEFLKTPGDRWSPFGFTPRPPSRLWRACGRPQSRSSVWEFLHSLTPPPRSAPPYRSPLPPPTSIASATSLRASGHELPSYLSKQLGNHSTIKHECSAECQQPRGILIETICHPRVVPLPVGSLYSDTPRSVPIVKSATGIEPHHT